MEAEVLSDKEPTTLHRLRAWFVHGLTASGAVLALIALEAITRGSTREALVVMAAACIIDGFDGTLARWFRVGEALPHVDGALMDNIVDYINYALVPAFFVLRAELVPAGWGVPAASLILVASCYQFSQKDAKTEDHYFLGFPSYWNVMVLYQVVLKLSPAFNLAIILLLGLLVFVPLKYVYPSRTVPLFRLTIVLSGVWACTVVGLILTLPAPPGWLVQASLAYLAYYFATSLYLSFADRTP